VNAKEFRITPAGLVFGCLERNTIDRACHGAEIARDATLTAVGIARKDNAAAIARRQIGLLLRILYGYTGMKHVQEDMPDRSDDTEHHLLHASATAPVISKLTRA